LSLTDRYAALTTRLRRAGDWVWPTALRAILFWEFWESGITKYRGENWFADIPWADWQKGFPWPFSAMPTDINWFFATWGELVFAVALLLGLCTRFAAISLVVVTAVAAAAVHWPAQWGSLGELWAGYAITAKGSAGNFKLALLFVIMLLPLVFHGGGKLSLDHLLLRRSGRAEPTSRPGVDLLAASLGCAVPGLAVVWVEPAWGMTLLVLAAALGIASVFRPAA
jgi:putative oxidoreductase